MFKNMKPIGGMLMAIALLMGGMPPRSLQDAAGTVTITPEMLHMKGNQCQLYVAGTPHKLVPGTYQNALLLVQEGEETGPEGGISHYGLYVDA